jgi:CheY-like chemotaxis protein/CheY-specific phosphatase CheX
MKELNEYINILIKSCESTIEQMTCYKVTGTSQKQVLREKGTFPFAHVIAYTDHDKKVDGDFVLAFGNVNDALKLASAIAEELGMDRFKEVCEDSTDLLNEFLNIVVGRTISEWDEIGLSVKFDTPVFKENYQNEESNELKGYLLALDISSDAVNLEKKAQTEQILLRVNFLEKHENLIENKKILLADDSRVMRGLIAKMLKKEGAQVREAQDGLEAVKIHKAFKPDLTLMDINMPKMSGLDAIAEIKTFEPDAKFIILSSSSRKDEIISAKTLKVSGYLVKPFKQEKLIEKIIVTL